MNWKQRKNLNISAATQIRLIVIRNPDERMDCHFPKFSDDSDGMNVCVQLEAAPYQQQSDDLCNSCPCTDPCGVDEYTCATKQTFKESLVRMVLIRSSFMKLTLIIWTMSLLLDAGNVQATPLLTERDTVVGTNWQMGFTNQNIFDVLNGPMDRIGIHVVGTGETIPIDNWSDENMSQLSWCSPYRSLSETIDCVDDSCYQKT